MPAALIRWQVQLADLVAASATVAGTPARLKKIAALAALLRQLAASEVGIAIRS